MASRSTNARASRSWFLLLAALLPGASCRRTGAPAGAPPDYSTSAPAEDSSPPDAAPAEGDVPDETAEPPPDPREDLMSRTYDVLLQDSRMFRAATIGVVVDDAAIPSEAKRLGFLELPSSVTDLEWLGTIEAIRADGCASPAGDGGCPASAGKFLAASLGPEGVAIVDVTDAVRPRLAARFDTPGAAMATEYVAPLLYVADGVNGLVAIDVSDPSAPRSAGSWPAAPEPSEACVASSGGSACGPTTVTPTMYARDIEVVDQGTTGYVAGGTAGVIVLDLAGFLRESGSGHGTAEPVAVIATPGDARAVSVQNDLVLVADGPAGLQVIDRRSGPGQPQPGIVGNYPTADMCRGVVASGTTAYLAVGDRGLEIVDVSNRTAPVRLGSFVPERPVNRVTIGPNGALLLANDAAGPLIVDASDPANVREVFPRPEE